MKYNEVTKEGYYWVRFCGLPEWIVAAVWPVASWKDGRANVELMAYMPPLPLPESLVAFIHGRPKEPFSLIMFDEFDGPIKNPDERTR